MSRSPRLEDAEVIHVYTRAQALADGVLVDVTDTAKEAGFRIPVALTAAVWSDCVAWPANDSAQDERGRLWDLLYLAAFEARRRRHAQIRSFRLWRVPCGGRIPESIRLALHIGPGDTAEPVITILQPEED
jgi:hypothetical protein